MILEAVEAKIIMAGGEDKSIKRGPGLCARSRYDVIMLIQCALPVIVDMGRVVIVQH